jgi:hypothetical protein
VRLLRHALLLALLGFLGGSARAEEALVLGAGQKIGAEKRRGKRLPTLLTDVTADYGAQAQAVPGEVGLDKQYYDFTKAPPDAWKGRFSKVLGQTIICVGCSGEHVDQMHGGIHVQREGLDFLRRVSTVLAPGGKAVLTATKSQVPGKENREIPEALRDSHPKAWAAWKAHARDLRKDGLTVRVSKKYGRIEIRRPR